MYKYYRKQENAKGCIFSYKKIYITAKNADFTKCPNDK